MYRSQQLALKYLTAAIALFGIMTVAGLMSAYYYINPDFLFGILNFNIAKILHIDIQKLRGLAQVDGSLWKWSFAALNIGLVGMVGALLVSGFAQAFVERAIGGSTHEAYLLGQANPWFVEGMIFRFVFGIMFAAGYVALIWDFLTVGKRKLVLAAAEAAE